jgi:hypothetical protein
MTWALGIHHWKKTTMWDAMLDKVELLFMGCGFQQ